MKNKIIIKRIGNPRNKFLIHFSFSMKYLEKGQFILFILIYFSIMVLKRQMIKQNK